MIEIKDAKSIGITPQWRGYAASEKPIDLIISPKTQTISQKIIYIVKKYEGSIKIYDPVTYHEAYFGNALYLSSISCALLQILV